MYLHETVCSLSWSDGFFFFFLARPRCLFAPFCLLASSPLCLLLDWFLARGSWPTELHCSCMLSLFVVSLGLDITLGVLEVS